MKTDDGETGRELCRPSSVSGSTISGVITLSSDEIDKRIAGALADFTKTETALSYLFEDLDLSLPTTNEDISRSPETVNRKLKENDEAKLAEFQKKIAAVPLLNHLLWFQTIQGALTARPMTSSSCISSPTNCEKTSTAVKSCPNLRVADQKLFSQSCEESSGDEKAKEETVCEKLESEDSRSFRRRSYHDAILKKQLSFSKDDDKLCSDGSDDHSLQAANISPFRNIHQLSVLPEEEADGECVRVTFQTPTTTPQESLTHDASHSKSSKTTNHYDKVSYSEDAITRPPDEAECQKVDGKIIPVFPCDNFEASTKQQKVLNRPPPVNRFPPPPYRHPPPVPSDRRMKYVSEENLTTHEPFCRIQSKKDTKAHSLWLLRHPSLEKPKCPDEGSNSFTNKENIFLNNPFQASPNRISCPENKKNRKCKMFCEYSMRDGGQKNLLLDKQRRRGVMAGGKDSPRIELLDTQGRITQAFPQPINCRPSEGHRQVTRTDTSFPFLQSTNNLTVNSNSLSRKRKNSPGRPKISFSNRTSESIEIKEDGKENPPHMEFPSISNKSKLKDIKGASSSTEIMESSETESTKDGRGGSMESEIQEATVHHPLNQSTDGDDSFLSPSDAYLSRLNLHWQSKSGVDHLPTDELENKFNSLALAFKTDRSTVRERLDSHRRQRDVAEKNIESEHAYLKNLINEINHATKDASAREKITNILDHLDIFMQSVSRLSSKAELYGSVQQEDKVSNVMDVVMTHTTNLTREKEKAVLELLDMKRQVTEVRFQYGVSPDVQRENQPPKIPPNRSNDARNRCSSAASSQNSSKTYNSLTSAHSLPGNIEASSRRISLPTTRSVDLHNRKGSMSKYRHHQRPHLTLQKIDSIESSVDSSEENNNKSSVHDAYSPVVNEGSEESVDLSEKMEETSLPNDILSCSSYQTSVTDSMSSSPLPQLSKSDEDVFITNHSDLCQKSNGSHIEEEDEDTDDNYDKMSCHDSQEFYDFEEEICDEPEEKETAKTLMGFFKFLPLLFLSFKLFVKTEYGFLAQPKVILNGLRLLVVGVLLLTSFFVAFRPFCIDHNPFTK